MQLLSPKDATPRLRKEIDEQVDTASRLSKIIRAKRIELDSLEANYDPKTLKAKREFEDFCRDLQDRKSKLLQGLTEIEAEIEKKKDIYFGLVAKQDALEEREHAVSERERKCELRENLISELERQWKAKTSS